MGTPVALTGSMSRIARIAPHLIVGLGLFSCEQEPFGSGKLQSTTFLGTAHAQQQGATGEQAGERTQANARRAARADGGADPAYTMPGALECLNRARSETFLGEGDAYLLCSGAESAAPLACYQEADTATFLPERLMFNLCRCAASTDPVRCFDRVQQDTFLEDREIVQLCSAINRRHLWPNCYPIAPVPY